MRTKEMAEEEGPEEGRRTGFVMLVVGMVAPMRTLGTVSSFVVRTVVLLLLLRLFLLR